MKSKKDENKAEKSVDKKIDKKVDKLNAQIQTLEAEKVETFEKLQRVSAEFANYQKRMTKQISDSASYEKESVIKAILPILDNFDHTMAGAEKAKSSDDLLKAMNMIYDQIISIFRNLGIEQIESLGKTFDPATHEAMMQRNEPEYEDGIVLDEFQKAYKLNDRLIRPGKVIVNKIEHDNANDAEEE